MVNQLEELKKKQKKKNTKKKAEPKEPEDSDSTKPTEEEKTGENEDKKSEIVPEAAEAAEEKASPIAPQDSSASAELEAKVKELEQQLSQANLTIAMLESDVSTYKTQLDSKSPTDEPAAESNEDDEEESDLKSEIENLRVENSYLNDKVYSLEARIANLIAMNKKRSIDFPRIDGNVGSDIDSEIGSLNSPILGPAEGANRQANAGQHHPRLASFVDMDLYGDINKIKDINKDMQRWSSWKVDMRGWRSLGVGPIFEA